MKPKAPDTVSLSRKPCGVRVRSPRETMVLVPRETCAPFSPSLYRPPSSGFPSHGVTVSFGLGACRAQRLAALRRANTLRCIRPMSASQYSSTTSTRTRQFPVRPQGLRLGRSDGLWGPIAWPGEGSDHVAHPFSASACRVRPCGASRSCGACCSPSNRRDQPLTLLSQLLLRFSLGSRPRLRVGPPGREPPRTDLSSSRDRE